MQILQHFGHSNCQSNTSDYKVNFVQMKLSAGKVISNGDKSMFYFSFIMKGVVTAKLGDYPIVTFRAGEMMFVPKYMDVTITALEDVESVIFVYNKPINLCEKKAIEDAKKVKDQLTYEFKSLPMNEAIYTFINQLIKYMDDGVYCTGLLQMKTTELFLIIMHYYSDIDKIIFFYHAIYSSMDFHDTVLANYKKVKTIVELATLCNMSLSDFNRKFRFEFRDTPYSWMLKRKSELIKMRLRDNGATIKAIALEYGFSSPAHFNTFCKKQLGGTPIQIKAQCKEEIPFMRIMKHNENNV